MIAHLSGRILFKSPTQSVIDCNGVGYEVFHTPFTADSLQGDRVSIYVHTHLREDALQLFGFASAEERSMFRELLKVNGVGPKLALSILSGLPVDELTEALTRKDMSRLQKIPGVGKKTAERLMLELSDKIAKGWTLSPSSTPLGASKTQDSDLESVLIHLGYQKSEVQRAVKNVRSKVERFEETSLETLVKVSLRELTQAKSL